MEVERVAHPVGGLVHRIIRLVVLTHRVLLLLLLLHEHHLLLLHVHGGHLHGIHSKVGSVVGAELAGVHHLLLRHHGHLRLQDTWDEALLLRLLLNWGYIVRTEGVYSVLLGGLFGLAVLFVEVLEHGNGVGYILEVADIGVVFLVLRDNLWLVIPVAQ